MEFKKLFTTNEIAVIAKENGFEEPCIAHHVFEQPENNYVFQLGAYFYREVKPNYTPAPLLQQMVDWLIEKHEIHPCYGSNHSGWYWLITKTNGTTIKEQSDCDYFTSHYEALNKAIEESFKLIK
jgi:hypothetical protein